MVEGLSTLHFPTALEHAQANLRKTLLVLARVLRLGDFDEHVGHDIPRIADPHDHEQQRCR